MASSRSKKKKVMSKKKVGMLVYNNPADVIKKLGAISESIQKNMTSNELFIFDEFFKGLKEFIDESVKKGLRSNQLVISIDKKLKEYGDLEKFFNVRLNLIQFRMAYDIYLIIKELGGRVIPEDKEKMFTDSKIKDNLTSGILLPLMYYDHKVEITILSENVKVIFTFYDEFKHDIYEPGKETGAMYMLETKKNLYTPLNNSVRNHSSISYRVVQTKDNIDGEPLIESNISFNKNPLIFGYYSI